MATTNPRWHGARTSVQLMAALAAVLITGCLMLGIDTLAAPHQDGVHDAAGSSATIRA